MNSTDRTRRNAKKNSTPARSPKSHSCRPLNHSRAGYRGKTTPKANISRYGLYWSKSERNANVPYASPCHMDFRFRGKDKPATPAHTFHTPPHPVKACIVRKQAGGSGLGPRGSGQYNKCHGAPAFRAPCDANTVYRLKQSR